MDMHLKTVDRPEPLLGEVDWNESKCSPLSLFGSIKAGGVTGILTLRRGNRGAVLEIRPDAANLTYGAYDEPGKFFFNKPPGWGKLQGGTIHIDDLPLAEMAWGSVAAWPGEYQAEDWTFATLQVLACNLTHEETDAIFIGHGYTSYDELVEE